MKPGQYSIRGLLIATGIIAVELGGLLAFFEAKNRAMREAEYQAIRAGRLELEAEREYIGEAAYKMLRAENEKEASKKSQISD